MKSRMGDDTRVQVTIDMIRWLIKRTADRSIRNEKGNVTKHARNRTRRRV